MLRKSAIRSPQNRDEKRSGTASVELAIVLPLFMVIVMGIAELSRGLDVSERLSSAVRQGGREAASDIASHLPAGWTANKKVISDIRNMLTASGLRGDKVTITIVHADGDQAGQLFDLEDPNNYLKYFKVAATVPYSDVGLLPSILKNRTLVASVVFRLGRSSLTK